MPSSRIHATDPREDDGDGWLEDAQERMAEMEHHRQLGHSGASSLGPSAIGMAQRCAIPEANSPHSKALTGSTPMTTPTSLSAADQSLLEAHSQSAPSGVGRSGLLGAVSFPHRDKPEHFPALLARSALFRVGRGSPKASIPAGLTMSIPAQKGYLLTAIGPRLSMRDKHIWEIAIQIAKESSPSIGEAFTTSLREIARRMGIKGDGRTLATIWDSLTKLCNVRLAFTMPLEGRAPIQGIGSLLATAIKDDMSIHLRVNPDFAWAAFALDKQFKIKSARRAKLSSTLAQWLHDFLSTHTAAHDMTVDYIREMCGFDGSARSFPLQLRTALDEMIKETPEIVASYDIDEVGRSSDRWIVRIARGPEKPQFIVPKPAILAGASGGGQRALSQIPKSARQRGLKL